MNVRSLLDIRIDAVSLAVSADHFVDARTAASVERAVKRVQKVIDENSAIGGGEPPPDAGEVARLFVRLCERDPDRLPDVFGTGRMARKLAASLCHRERDHVPIARTEHLQRALGLLARHDRTSVLLGVLDALLQTWDDRAAADRLRAFLAPRLSGYSGRLQPLIKARENEAFLLRPDGAVNLGGKTAAAGRPFGDAVDALSLSARARTTPYGDEVAVAFARTALRVPNASPLVRSLLHTLEERERGDVHKRCLAPILLAIDADADPDPAVQEHAQAVAFHMVGDPVHDHLWAPWPTATPAEADEVRRAQTVLSRWIAQQIITVFFEKVAMDPDRKAFWLRYASHVTRFRIYSDTATRWRLESDARIKPYLRGRFCVGAASTGASALMMRVKDRTVVEFSETGNACYVYRARTLGPPSSTSVTRQQTAQEDVDGPLVPVQGIVHL